MVASEYPSPNVGRMHPRVDFHLGGLREWPRIVLHAEVCNTALRRGGSEKGQYVRSRPPMDLGHMRSCGEGEMQYGNVSSLGKRRHVRSYGTVRL